nr:Coat protein/Movement Protein [Sweet potato collusive virus]
MDKEFNNLNIGQHVYKISENKLPINSFLKWPGYTHATFTPYVVIGDAGDYPHRQLNWTNKFLWNKLGNLNNNDINILRKPIITEEDKKELSEEAKKIIDEKFEDRIKYLKNINQTLDLKWFKFEQEQNKKTEELLDTIKILNKELKQLKEEIKNIKKKNEEIIYPPNTYTINMVTEEGKKFDQFLYMEQLERERISKEQAIEKILENTYILNNNIGYSINRIETLNTTVRTNKRPETILDTPQYAKYREQQRIIKEEIKNEPKDEYEQFLNWKKDKEREKIEFEESERIRKGKNKVIIIPDIIPDPPKEDINQQLLRMIEEMRKEIKELKTVKEDVEHLKIQLKQDDIQMMLESENELDPDNLDKEEIIEKIQNINIESEEENIEENIEENTSESESELEPEVNIKEEQYEEDDRRQYKPYSKKYKTNVRYARNINRQDNNRNNYINRRRTQFEPDYIHTNIGENGEALNLNCTDAKESEERIEKWAQSMSITITKQNMTNDNAKKFIIRTLLGDVKDWYENLTESAKSQLEGTSALSTLANIEVAIRAEFGKLGIENDATKMTRKKNSARAKLMQLSICNMRMENLKAYICEFKEYFYKAAYSDEEREQILDIFYTKLPDPWGITILEAYNINEKGKITLDSLGSRITYLFESITARCEQDRMNKIAKKTMKLDCGYYEVGQYGCKTKNYKKKTYKKRKKRYIPIYRKNKPKPWMKYYRPKNKIKRNKKPCTCYNCGEVGHISPNCKKPKKSNKTINNIEMVEFIGDQEELEFIINDNDIIYIEQIIDTENSDIELEMEFGFDEINMFQEEGESSIIRSNDESEQDRPTKMIFNKEKFSQILEKDLDLTKNDVFKNKNLKQLFGKKDTEYFVVTDIEHPIDVKYVQNMEQKVNLPLYNQQIFEKEIQKIPDKDKNKIKNIHLAAVEVIIKGYFREGIDTPIEILLCDDRITYPNNGSIIATLVGNLIYQQVKFKKIINYSISVRDKNLEKSLVMYWNLDGIKMIENSKIFSIRLRNLYVLSEKHIVKNKKQYKENIIIEPLFQEVIQNNDVRYIDYIKPEKDYEQAKMITYKNKFEIGESSRKNEQDIGKIIKEKKGISNKIITLPRESYKQNRNQFHIKGKIGNKYYPILIDTGAARSYISSKIIDEQSIKIKPINESIISIDYNNIKTCYNNEAELDIEITDLNFKIHNIKFNGLIETIELLEQDKQQVLIGIDTLEQLKPYSITSDYLEINIGYKPIKIKRELKDIYELSRQLSQHE